MYTQKNSAIFLVDVESNTALLFQRDQCDKVRCLPFYTEIFVIDVHNLGINLCIKRDHCYFIPF